MPGMMENLSTVNSFLRTLIAMVVIGVLGVGGWFGYTTFNAAELAAKKSAQDLADANDKLLRAEQGLVAAQADIAQKTARIEEQATEIKALGEKIDRLQTSLTLLKIDHRVARLSVIDQGKDEATGKMFSKVEFVELNDEGQPIDTPREFRIPGDTVYVDAWVVKFLDKYVEAADLERGTSLIMFKRLFGNDQKPDDGYPLDEVGAAPKAYLRGGQMSEFEKAIFDDFWSIANDKAKAVEKGIDAAYGDAGYIKVEKGKNYIVRLRASGGPSIVPE
jgi:hypothetical protein